jgi:hypothetical protein
MPFQNSEAFSESFDILDEVLSRVFTELGIRSRLPSTSLVKKNNTIYSRIKEDSVGLGGLSARTTVQKYY